MAADAMFKLEHSVGDKAKSKEIGSRIEHLEVFQKGRWQDDYASNKALRSKMRVSNFL